MITKRVVFVYCRLLTMFVIYMRVRRCGVTDVLASLSPNLGGHIKLINHELGHHRRLRSNQVHGEKGKEWRKDHESDD